MQCNRIVACRYIQYVFIFYIMCPFGAILITRNSFFLQSYHIGSRVNQNLPMCLLLQDDGLRMSTACS